MSAEQDRQVTANVFPTPCTTEGEVGVTAETLRESFEGAVTRIVARRFGLHEPTQRVVQVGASGLCGNGGRCVDVLGKLVDRLPDALTVAEVCLVLDRFDVALRGHGSPSVDADGAESRVALTKTVGDDPGVVPSATPGCNGGCSIRDHLGES